MANVLELSDATFQRLQRVAEEQGITPAEWIESTLSRQPLTQSTGSLKSVAEALVPYIRCVDSSKHPPDPKHRSAFGDIVDEKMAKQGLKRPEWRR
jgi:hypothetical protein